MIRHEEWCDRGCDCGVGDALEDALRVENNTLRALLLDAWSRMDRVRNILYRGDPNTMWNMLNTQCDRDKLDALRREGK